MKSTSYYQIIKRSAVSCAFVCGLTATSVMSQSPINNLYFGSCAKQSKPIPIFDAIVADQPQVFAFLGDNIYGDTEDMQVLASKYTQLGNNPGFKKLKQTSELIAIWDDHDFGANDAGFEYPQKEASRQIMLDFWQEPKDSPRYTRNGIYTSYSYGSGDNIVRVIMPDLRWNRTKLNSVGQLGYISSRRDKKMGPYSPSDNLQSTMLGDEQWLWLQQELLKPAKVRIIASSIQLVPEFTGWESWANFPQDKQRLFEFIKTNKVDGVIVISGDTHWGEISKVHQPGSYPIWEITSSGLSEKWKDVSPNKYRIGHYTNQINYGFMTFDWESDDPTIEFGLRDVNGDSVMGQTIKLSELSFDKVSFNKNNG